MWPQNSMYFLDSVQFPILSISFHFSPSSFSSQWFAKAINSPSHSSWTHSSNSFTPFNKSCSFKAAVPKFSLPQRELISAPQSLQINNTASSPRVPPAPTLPFPHLWVSISPCAPTGGRAASAAGEAALKVRRAACCSPPRKSFGRSWCLA